MVAPKKRGARTPQHAPPTKIAAAKRPTKVSGKAGPGANLAGVPRAMLEAPRWLVWGYKNKRKVPAGLWRDPKHWRSYTDAKKARQSLGFVLGDGWAGIDVDGAWPTADAANSPDTMQEHGRKVWDLCKGAYVERSPSGTGFKVFVRFDKGDAPADVQATEPLPGDHIGTEVYHTAGRWFAVTGDALPGCGKDLGNTKAQKGWLATVATLQGHARDRVRAIDTSDADGLAGLGAVRPYTEKLEAELRVALSLLPSDDRKEWVRFAHALKAMGWTGEHEEAAFDLWHEWSERGSKYAGEDECRKTWATVKKPRGDVSVAAIFARAKEVAGDASEDPSAGGSTLQTHTSDTVENRNVRWLWGGYIARGYLNLVCGETGVSKTGLALDLAARITRGDLFPGEEIDVDELCERKPGRVLYLGNEDSIAETVGPRLKAAGADETKFHVITGVLRDGKRDEFSMQDDLQAVRQFVHQYKDSDAPVTMLILDPITAYLSGQKVRKVDLNDNGQLRRILTPWLDLAQETGIAPICITHLTKDTARQLLHRVLGAGVFAATARSVCYVTKLEADGPYHGAVLQIKTNLPLPDSYKPGGFRFVTSKVQTGIDRETGQPIPAIRTEWQDTDPALTVASLSGGSRGPESQYGPIFRAWLRAYFGDPMSDEKPVETVKAAAIEACGFSAGWWDKHSKDFLEKTNPHGVWMCRLRAP